MKTTLAIVAALLLAAPAFAQTAAPAPTTSTAKPAAKPADTKKTPAKTPAKAAKPDAKAPATTTK